MECEFKGQIGLITGVAGETGIGGATARRLFESGAKLVLADIDEGAVTEFAEKLDSSGQSVRAIRVDVSDHDEVRKAVQFACDTFGGLHLAVNNAGITSSPAVPLPEVDWELYQRVMRINVGGVFAGLKYEIPAISQSGGGAIVNTASMVSVIARAGLSPYVASKHAVLGLTRAAALDAPANVRVNCVGPGLIRTPMTAGRSEDYYDQAAAQSPLGRVGRPEDVAEMIAFLLSKRAAFITGSIQLVDGGYTVS